MKENTKNKSKIIFTLVTIVILIIVFLLFIGLITSDPTDDSFNPFICSDSDEVISSLYIDIKIDESCEGDYERIFLVPKYTLEESEVCCGIPKE